MFKIPLRYSSLLIHHRNLLVPFSRHWFVVYYLLHDFSWLGHGYISQSSPLSLTSDHVALPLYHMVKLLLEWEKMGVLFHMQFWLPKGILFIFWWLVTSCVPSGSLIFLSIFVCSLVFSLFLCFHISFKSFFVLKETKHYR